MRREQRDVVQSGIEELWPNRCVCVCVCVCVQVREGGQRLLGLDLSALFLLLGNCDHQPLRRQREAPCNTRRAQVRTTHSTGTPGDVTETNELMSKRSQPV